VKCDINILAANWWLSMWYLEKNNRLIFEMYSIRVHKKQQQQTRSKSVLYLPQHAFTVSVSESICNQNINSQPNELIIPPVLL
jgi:hypothetical protein